MPCGSGGLHSEVVSAKCEDLAEFVNTNSTRRLRSRMTLSAYPEQRLAAFRIDDAILQLGLMVYCDVA